MKDWMPWVTNPMITRFAENHSFSSFSACHDDLWAQEIERRFDIVVRPGYVVPREIETTLHDSMWLAEAPRNSVVVWDGFDAVALHEIIMECMDYRGASDIIQVVDRMTGLVVPDPRSFEVLSRRPRRWRGMALADVEGHRLSLKKWARESRCFRTSAVLHPESAGANRETPDYKARYSAWSNAGMTFGVAFAIASGEGGYRRKSVMRTSPLPDRSMVTNRFAARASSQGGNGVADAAAETTVMGKIVALISRRSVRKE